MTETLKVLSKEFKGFIKEFREWRGETTIIVDRQKAHNLLLFLKGNAGFNSLIDVSSAHYPDEGFLTISYIVRNMKTIEQVRVQAILPLDEPSIESVCDIWKGANFFEREVYDLMGIYFLNHPDLKRIMMPEDFEGHPLRKEYPLEGYDEWRNYVD